MRTDPVRAAIEREIRRWDGLESQQDLQVWAPEMAKAIARVAKAAMTREKKRVDEQKMVAEQRYLDR